MTICFWLQPEDTSLVEKNARALITDFTLVCDLSPEYVPFVMVVQSAETGKVRTRLPQGQVHTFMMAATGHPLDALFLLALTTSMRKGEILDLTRLDVDYVVIRNRL